MDPLVVQHLNASDRNLAIAFDLSFRPIGGSDYPAHEWVVVVSFYSSVRCINAYLLFRNGLMPRTHAQRTRAIWQVSELLPVLLNYARLENWSRDARYTHSYSAFDDVSTRIALESARMIRNHIQDLLRTGE